MCRGQAVSSEDQKFSKFSIIYKYLIFDPNRVRKCAQLSHFGEACGKVPRVPDAAGM